MSDYQNISIHSGVLASLLRPGAVLQLRFISSPTVLEPTVTVPVVAEKSCCDRREAGTDATIQVCSICLPTVLDMHALESFQRAPELREQPAAAALHDLTMGW